jgi:hypothetical protein
MTYRENAWRVASTLGGVVGYGCLAAFLALVGLQTYRWAKEGEWMHLSLADGMRAALRHLHVAADAPGLWPRLAHWLDAPVDWLGLHKVVEVLPASLVLFSIAIAGNFLFVYGSDRLRDHRRAG